MKNNSNISVIVTVRNEEKTILGLLEALRAQTLPPKEVVIVDAASTDKTVEQITEYAKLHDLNIKLESFPCNRSTGRNRAIELAKSELIATTDSGCLPHPKWLKELVAAFRPGHVVAGIAEGKPTSSFQKAVIPYFLIMPDRIDSRSYLPTTRSMLLEKATWAQLGGFDENLNTSEDFIFSREMVRQGIPITFAPEAIVDWIPLRTFTSFCKQILTFAVADAQMGALRPRVFILFGRYIFGTAFALFLLRYLHLGIALTILWTCFGLYLLWAISKNKKYVDGAWLWLPILQLSADFLVMIGTGWGAFTRLLRLGN